MFVLPMVGVETFKAMTGRNEDELLAEIQLGRVRWAFNVSSEESRMFVKILVRSIDCYRWPALKQPETFDAFIDSWLPPISKISGTVLGTTLQKLLNVSGDHIADLINAELIRAEKRKITTGPQGTAKIKRTSVVTFMRARWLGADAITRRLS